MRRVRGGASAWPRGGKPGYFRRRPASHRRRFRLIKYLGSKRRLVPALSAIAQAVEARTAIDLFTGTTRVAQAFKQAGAHVTAVDTARYAHVFARCSVETDARSVAHGELAAVLAGLDGLPGRPGY